MNDVDKRFVLVRGSGAAQSVLLFVCFAFAAYYVLMCR